MELFLTSNFLKNFNTSSELPRNFNLSVLQKLENGMYLINMRGNNYKVNLPENTKKGLYKAEIVQKNNDGDKQLKLTLVKETENIGNKSPNKSLDLKQGDILDVKIIKSIKKNIYLVEIKGKKIEVFIDDVKNLLKFKAKVVDFKDDYPKLELYLDKTDIIKTNSDIKANLIKFDKDALINVLKSSLKFNLSSISSNEIKKAIQDSGNFFENKLLNNFDIKDDNKFNAIKNNNFELKDGIQKLQLFNSLSENTIFTFFSMDNSEINDAEAFISKTKTGFSVHLKVDFSEIGETHIKIVHRESFTDVVVSSEKDISEQLKSLNLPGLNIHWKKITEQEKKQFDLDYLIKKKISGFEVIA